MCKATKDGHVQVLVFFTKQCTHNVSLLREREKCVVPYNTGGGKKGFEFGLDTCMSDSIDETSTSTSSTCMYAVYYIDFFQFDRLHSHCTCTLYII